MPRDRSFPDRRRWPHCSNSLIADWTVLRCMWTLDAINLLPRVADPSRALIASQLKTRVASAVRRGSSRTEAGDIPNRSGPMLGVVSSNLRSPNQPVGRTRRMPERMADTARRMLSRALSPSCAQLRTYRTTCGTTRIEREWMTGCEVAGSRFPLYHRFTTGLQDRPQLAYRTGHGLYLIHPSADLPRARYLRAVRSERSDGRFQGRGLDGVQRFNGTEGIEDAGECW